MGEFTYEQTKEMFVLAWNSNAYLKMCESSDIKNAINALDKQIPKKPEIKLNGTTGMNTFCHCPNCKSIIVGNKKYCDNCGQALDWSDENG